MPEQIVWINKSPWRKPGPIVAMGVRNAAAFASCGWSSVLFVSAEEPVAAETLRAELTSFYGLTEVPDSLQIRAVAGRRGRHWLRPVYVEARSAIRAQLRRGDRVLVLTREEGALPFLLRLRDRHPRQLRIVHETHDFFADLEHLGRRPLWDERRRQVLARRYFPRLDGLLTLTEEQIALYRRHLRSCPPVLAQPLGTENRAEWGAATLRQRRTLSYVGHLHASKGRQTILEAAKRLSQAGIHLLLLGGTEDQARKLQTRLDQRMKAAGRARVVPFLPPKRMHRQLNQGASAGLVLLEDDFYNRNLTCPVKALDSLSHGMPSLASDLPSTRQVLGDAAHYLPPGDADALVAAARALFDSAEDFERLARAARARREQLAWPRRAERIMEWIDAL